MIDKWALSSKHEIFIDPLFHQFPTALKAKHILDKISHTDQMFLWQKLLIFPLQFEICCILILYTLQPYWFLAILGTSQL